MALPNRDRPLRHGVHSFPPGKDFAKSSFVFRRGAVRMRCSDKVGVVCHRGCSYPRLTDDCRRLRGGHPVRFGAKRCQQGVRGEMAAGDYDLHLWHHSSAASLP